MVDKQIAHELSLSTSTVRTHLHNIYGKLGAVDRAQAVLHATERGWLLSLCATRVGSVAPMLSITTKRPYALRALTELARMGADAPVPIGELAARRREIPVQFLEQLFAVLRRAGLLRSQRGVKGGYAFAREPSDNHRARARRKPFDGPLGNGAVGNLRGTRPPPRVQRSWAGPRSPTCSSASRARPARRCTTSRRGHRSKAGCLALYCQLDSARTRSNPLESGALPSHGFPTSRSRASIQAASSLRASDFASPLQRREWTEAPCGASRSLIAHPTSIECSTAAAWYPVCLTNARCATSMSTFNRATLG